MKARKAATYLGFLGIGALLFYLAAAAVEDWDALLRDMQSASWPGILASFVMGYLAIVSRGMRWLLLLEPLGHKPKAAHSVHAVAFAYFANTFVPRSGELARCAALNQTDDIPVDQLFGTVISERVIDFVFLFALMSLAILGNLDAFARLLESMGVACGSGTALPRRGCGRGAGRVFAVQEAADEVGACGEGGGVFNGRVEGAHQHPDDAAEGLVHRAHRVHLDHVFLHGVRDLPKH